MAYLSGSFWLILNYSNPKMLKKETPKYNFPVIHKVRNVVIFELLCSER